MNGKIYTEKGVDDFVVEKRLSDSGDEQIVLKSGGDVIDISISSMREKLRSLYDVRNTRISELSPKHRNIYDVVVSIMAGLNQTSCYNEVLNVIDEIFSKGGNKILPGTVYAYFYGCKVHSNFTPYSCSPVCSGSVQPINMGDGWVICDRYTLLYDIEDSKFTIMNDPNNKEDAYIFISSRVKFDGFTEPEKDVLRDNGIVRVKIVSYDGSGSNTTDLFDEFVSLDDVATRQGNNFQITNDDNENGYSDNYWYTIIFWVLIGILILLVIGFIIYLFVYASKKNNKKKQDKKSEELLYESMMSDSAGDLSYDMDDLSALGRYEGSSPRSRSPMAAAMSGGA
jgi:hypothetical protein